MKRVRFPVSCFLALCVLALSPCFAPCAEASHASQSAVATSLLSPQDARRTVGARSRAVVRALKNRDLKTLSRYVHPRLGLRFSPYISPRESDRVFSVAQLRRLPNDKTRYLWGSYDGSGETIRLTWSEYRKSFVYPRNFLSVKPTFNMFVSRGNTINNLRRAFPNAVFAEYHVRGTNPKLGGLDWRSLWLVWRHSGQSWKLVGIAGDQWTI